MEYVSQSPGKSEEKPGSRKIDNTLQVITACLSLAAITATIILKWWDVKSAKDNDPLDEEVKEVRRFVDSGIAW